MTKFIIQENIYAAFQRKEKNAETIKKNMLVKKIFLFILFSCISSVAAFSQDDISVNQVNSDAEALAFVKQQNYDKNEAPQWNHFYLTDGTEWQSYYNLSEQQADSLKQNMATFRWQKADLNQDGKPDLIVSGYIARRPKDWATTTFKLLVFLSQGGKSYTDMNLIDDRLDKYPAYFSLVNIDDRSYLQLYRWHITPNETNVIPLHSDTLKYNNVIDYFVHLSNYLNPLEVRRIDYSVQENHNGAYHTLSIENLNGKGFPMNISLMREGLKTPQNYKARLTKALWDNIDTLTRNIQFAGDSIVYNDESEIDKLPITLTVHFSDGSKKIIKDYDANASYTLMTIYQIFEEIVSNTLDMYEQRQEQLQQQMNDNWDW